MFSQAVIKDSAREDDEKIKGIGGRLDEFVRGGVTSGVGGLDGRRGVNAPGVLGSEEVNWRGVRSPMLSSFAPGGVKGGAGATMPFCSGETGWARSRVGTTIPLRGSALWDLRSGRSEESTESITSTPGMIAKRVTGSYSMASTDSRSRSRSRIAELMDHARESRCREGGALGAAREANQWRGEHIHLQEHKWKQTIVSSHPFVQDR